MKPLLAIVSAASLFAILGAASAPGCCAIDEPTKVAASKTETVTTLHIEGMTCGSCATAVRHVVKNIDGVKDAKVSYQEKKAVVTYDASRVTPQKIVHTITEKLPTYKATVVE